MDKRLAKRLIFNQAGRSAFADLQEELRSLLENACTRADMIDPGQSQLLR
jgi:hypothetical protein